MFDFMQGLAFGLLFLTWLKGRVMPLVVTHSLLDIVAFLGAPLLPWLMPEPRCVKCWPSLMTKPALTQLN